MSTKTEAEVMLALERVASDMEPLSDAACKRIRDWAVDRWPHLFKFVAPGGVAEGEDDLSEEEAQHIFDITEPTLAIAGVPITGVEPFESITQAAEFRHGVLGGDVLAGEDGALDVAPAQDDVLGFSSHPFSPFPSNYGPWRHAAFADLEQVEPAIDDGVARMEREEDKHKSRIAFVEAVARHDSELVPPASAVDIGPAGSRATYVKTVLSAAQIEDVLEPIAQWASLHPGLSLLPDSGIMQDRMNYEAENLLEKYAKASSWSWVREFYVNRIHPDSGLVRLKMVLDRLWADRQAEPQPEDGNRRVNIVGFPPNSTLDATRWIDPRSRP